MSYGAYQPAHEAHLTKHHNQMYEFDSPATIAKQQQHLQQPMVQAGGAPSTGFAAPPPPPLPQLGFRNSGPSNLRTRDWASKPWNGQGNAYMPPPSLLKNYSSSSLGKYPVFMPSSSSSSTWGDRSISSTTASPRTPSLLGVYDPDLLAGQTTHLKSDHTTHSHPQASGLQSGLQQPGLQSSGSQSAIQPALQTAMQSGLQTGHSGLPSTNYSPSSTIPLSHNFHLPSSNLSQSSIPSSNANLSSIPSSNANLSTIPSGSNFSLAKNSSIPAAPAFTGFRHGAWRANRSKPNLRLRTRNWGTRSKKGWSGFNSRSTLDEAFLRNRPMAAPVAPPMRSLFATRKWRTGPYRMRPLRTRNWGGRTEDGWAHFNRGIYSHESALPFMANRLKWAESTETTRAAPAIAAPLQQSSSFIQQAPIASSFIQQAPIAAAPIAAPLAAPVPLKGRKARRAQRKLAKQQAIQSKLTSELNPPVGDPAINHYRRGAKATVPLAGPNVGLANPSGSIASRRTGKRNTLGRRRNRLAAPALPVPATQPPVVAPIAAAPLTSAPLLSSAPIISSAPLSATSAAFVPISAAPLSSSTGSHQPIAPSFARSTGLVSSAGIPLTTTTQAPSSLYSSAAQQSRPLSSNFAQPIAGSNQPLYSAHEPVAAQIMEKKTQPIIQNRPIGSATL